MSDIHSQSIDTKLNRSIIMCWSIENEISKTKCFFEKGKCFDVVICVTHSYAYFTNFYLSIDNWRTNKTLNIFIFISSIRYEVGDFRYLAGEEEYKLKDSRG